jgi:hypothetical protein
MSDSPQKLNFASKAFFFTASQWENIDLSDDSVPLIGNATSKIIRLGTKNIIEAPEKSFKTTFAQRFMLGLSIGKTVYSHLPVAQHAHVLYFHGELTPAELAERRSSAVATIPGFKGDNYIEGRSIDAHFIKEPGRQDIRKWVMQFRPKDNTPYVVVFDPWQAFILGYDENSFEAQSQATGFLDRLIVESSSTMFFQMHQGKDRTKGARGHSSVSGWKDTTIRLNRKGEKELIVRVEPRWAEKFEFGLTFENGTLIEKNVFAPASLRIRQILEKDFAGWAPRDALVRTIGGGEEAAKKSIQRALREKAVIQNAAGKIGLPFDDWD